MRKYAYLARLEELLAALPAQERQEALNYYEEYFDAAGSDREEQTAAELGDPAGVARKILEGEGIDFPEGETPAADILPAQQREAARQAEEASAPEASQGTAAPRPAAQETPPEAPSAGDGAPEPPLMPPAGPEPPALDEPGRCPRQGVAAPPARSGKGTRRLWLIFWLLILLALLIQLSALVFGLGGLGLGGSTASMTASSAVAEGPVPTAPASGSELSDPMQITGTVAYSSALETNGGGTLHVQVLSGNVAFRTGDAGHIEVRNMDAGEPVTLENAWGETNFYCGSTDPDAHITITLPAEAYDRIEVELELRGAVDLDDLSAAEIDVWTAEGQIHSGTITVEELTARTEQGNIWLEKVAGSTGSGPDSVTLEAPAGSVGVTLQGTQDLWLRTITAPDGMSAEHGTVGSAQAERELNIAAGSTVTVAYEP